MNDTIKPTAMSAEDVVNNLTSLANNAGKINDMATALYDILTEDTVKQQHAPGTPLRILEEGNIMAFFTMVSQISKLHEYYQNRLSVLTLARKANPLKEATPEQVKEISMEERVQMFRKRIQDATNTDNSSLPAVSEGLPPVAKALPAEEHVSESETPTPNMLPVVEDTEPTVEMSRMEQFYSADSMLYRIFQKMPWLTGGTGNVRVNSDIGGKTWKWNRDTSLKVLPIHDLVRKANGFYGSAGGSPESILIRLDSVMLVWHIGAGHGNIPEQNISAFVVGLSDVDPNNLTLNPVYTLSSTYVDKVFNELNALVEKL